MKDRPRSFEVFLDRNITETAKDKPVHEEGSSLILA